MPSVDVRNLALVHTEAGLQSENHQAHTKVSVANCLRAPEASFSDRSLPCCKDDMDEERHSQIHTDSPLVGECRYRSGSGITYA